MAEFPFEFPYESSPVDFFTGSNETESEDEDDYVAGLAQRVAHSMLEDDDAIDETFALRNMGLHQQEKSMKASSLGLLSPQSMASSWSSSSTLSSKGSSRVSSQVSSPPSTPFGAKDDARDLIHMAAGEAVRLQMLEDAMAYSNGLNHALTKPISNGLAPSSWAQGYPSLLSTQNKEYEANNSYFSSSAPSGKKAFTVPTQPQYYQHSIRLRKKEDDCKSSRQQLRGSKIGSSSTWARQVKPAQQQYINGASKSMQKNGICHGASKSMQKNGICQQGRVVPQSLLRSSIQPIAGMGMRAVFLGPNGSGRECCGTGVFLPRRPGNASDCRKKPSCSTVLLPTRVVQALNLNIQDMCSPIDVARRRTSCQGARSISSTSPSSVSLSNILIQPCTSENGRGGERKPVQKIHSTPEHVAAEVFLPNEWIY